METGKSFYTRATALAALLALAGCVGGARPCGRGTLCLTFDDANWPRWEAALPIFAKHGAHASFFPNGKLDDAALASLRRIADAGHTVGPHTQGHADAPPFFERHGAEKYWELQVKPQMDALAKVGIRPRSMAYPNNRRTDETDAFLKTKGFRRFRAGYPGVRPYDPKHLKKAELKPLAEIDEVFLPADRVASTAWMRGVGIGEAYNTDIDDVLAALDRAAARNETIVFFSHNIAPDAKSISMKTEWLERILAHAQALGMRIAGFDEL